MNFIVVESQKKYCCWKPEELESHGCGVLGEKASWVNWICINITSNSFDISRYSSSRWRVFVLWYKIRSYDVSKFCDVFLLILHTHTHLRTRRPCSYVPGCRSTPQRVPLSITGTEILITFYIVYCDIKTAPLLLPFCVYVSIISQVFRSSSI